jgi:hypothetical protein
MIEYDFAKKRDICNASSICRTEFFAPTLPLCVRHLIKGKPTLAHSPNSAN